MPRPATGNTELVQFRLTKSQKKLLEEYAASQHITLAELTRQQLRLLLSRIVAGHGASGSL